MTAPDTTLEGLAGRCEAATGADRELDADIAEHVHGWRLASIGPDYDGNNACEVLTETGRLYEGFGYPPRGAIARYYHVPQHTRDCLDPAFPKDAVRKQLAAALRARARQAEAG